MDGSVPGKNADTTGMGSVATSMQYSIVDWNVTNNHISGIPTMYRRLYGLYARCVELYQIESLTS